MKTAITTLFLAITLTVTAHATSIKIGREVFHLAESRQSRQSTLEEYVPKGQSLKNWTRLVSVRHFHNVASPRDYITNMASEYRQQYPHMKFAVDQSGGDWYFDCIVYSRGGGPKFAEWSFSAARPSNKGGIVVHQYAVIVSYQNSVREALDALDVKSFRQRMLPILKKSSFAPQL